ncbi:hypothetical protein BC938DRAFT_473900 [Jimgerdemannia flammicorona]|uniref:Uncharacterized protein n=1 Tax=Jimgerdemannia flammicorona TaxID=994334 RepID=A0A433QSY7_9FUNG|nr:hypothetical protein BC938DRAFT_473900 [Jimgerdemannia flammicorona]
MGEIPRARRMHTAVLASDGFSIIICCGGTQLASVNLNDVAVLDTRTWQWMQPVTNGNAPEGRLGLSSVMINGQMLIFFGSNGSCLNDVAILDTRTTPYQWASSFSPNSNTPSPTYNTSYPASNTPGPPSYSIDSLGGIGGIVGISIGVILFSILIFLLIRKQWQRRSHRELPQEQDVPFRGSPMTEPQLNQKPDQNNRKPDQYNQKPMSIEIEI